MAHSRGSVSPPRGHAFGFLIYYKHWCFPSTSTKNKKDENNFNFDRAGFAMLGLTSCVDSMHLPYISRYDTSPTLAFGFYQCRTGI